MPRAGRIVRRVAGNAARAARRLAAQMTLPRRGGFWVVVRLTEPVEDLPAPPLPGSGNRSVGMLEALQTLSTAATDSRVAGVVLRLGSAPLGFSRALSLHRAVEELRRSGKPVVAYAEILSNEGMLVASAADKLWIPETGQIFLLGIRLEGLFLRGLLEHLDVKPEVVRVGDYKTAGEHFTRDAMSDAEREQMERLADDWFEVLVSGIAAGRGLEASAVRDRIDRGPYSGRAAVEAGLADGCLYPDELDAELESLSAVRLADPPSPRPDSAAPAPPRVPLVEGSVYWALRGRDSGWWPLLAPIPRVVYLVARGGIHRGSGFRGVACDPFRELLETIRRDEEVRALVLRLDSPGGDAIASDLLWRSVTLVQREKPVVVTMGNVVASGGYYIAAAADAVFAEAGTLTGSIGVVGGKLNLEGLYDRVGVSKDAVERGARAGLLSETRGFTRHERDALREGMSGVYDAFLDRVSRGRGISGRELDQVAGGRVWSGERARSLGLVDAIGGPLEALREARRRAGISESERVIVDLLPRTFRFPSLRSLLRVVPGSVGTLP
jgi:protease-4